MKTYRIENFGSDIYKNDEFGGAVHAVIEALFYAIKDKSWDRIISIGTDPTTFEGTVEYEDGDSQDSDLDDVYSFIHQSCYYAANLMRYYIYSDRYKGNQFFGFVTGYLFTMDSELRDLARDSTVASIAYQITDYKMFIESLASEMVPDRRYTREEIEAKFSEMGFTFPEK